MQTVRQRIVNCIDIWVRQQLFVRLVDNFDAMLFRKLFGFLWVTGSYSVNRDVLHNAYWLDECARCDVGAILLRQRSTIGVKRARDSR